MDSKQHKPLQEHFTIRVCAVVRRKACTEVITI